MTVLAGFRSWVRSLIWRSRLETELDEELRSHLANRTDDLMRSGLPKEEAERRARLEFGSLESHKESCREARGLRWPDEVRQDLRFAFRSFRRNPGFTAVAVLTLALGMGANTAMFTVVESVLLQPLPYREPRRLVMVYSVGSFGPFSWNDGPLADPDYLELRKARAFSDLAAFTTAEASMTGDGEPIRLSRSEVTGSLFSLLGERPALGRVFSNDEGEGNGTLVAVLSDALWRSRFGADSAVVGKVATLEGTPHTIVGVMPPEFNFPRKTQLWTPLRLRPTYRDNSLNRVIGRLAAGVTPEQALAEVQTIIRSAAEGVPPEKRLQNVRIADLHESMVGKVSTLLLVLLGAVGCVLLVACANMASLLTARAAARGQEMSIRASLGAGRARLLRQLLTESVALATMGGGLGLLLAHLGLPFILGWVPPEMLPRIEEVRVNAPVLGFTFFLCLLTGLLFGLAPALSYARRGAVRPLQERSGSGATREETWLRGLLIVGETALVLVLLVGAGLLLKSLWKLQNVDPGFRRDRILTMTVPLPERLYATVAQKRDFYVRLLERIETLPGAEDASAVNLLPFGFASWKGDFAVEGREYKPTDLVVGKPAVSESYFRIMGIPLLRGRAFEARDRDGAPLVTVVSESVARFCWGDEDPLGKRLTMDDPKAGRWLTVVGIVGDIRQDNLAAERLPMIYVPLRQESRGFFLWAMAFVVRPRGEPAAIVDALRDQVRALDPELPVQRIEFLDRLLSESLAEPRFRTGLLLTFALLALLLALVGIYGVIAYEVARRTCEIGIRRALGAQTSDVLRLVVGRTAALVSIGLVGGLLGAVAITRVLASFLFGVQPIDVGTFFVVSLGLAVVAILASVVPARRAARVDPAVALRYE